MLCGSSVVSNCCCCDRSSAAAAAVAVVVRPLRKNPGILLVVVDTVGAALCGRGNPGLRNLLAEAGGCHDDDADADAGSGLLLVL